MRGFTEPSASAGFFEPEEDVFECDCCGMTKPVEDADPCDFCSLDMCDACAEGHECDLDPEGMVYPK